jgi:hypothetical protein
MTPDNLYHPGCRVPRSERVVEAGADCSEGRDRAVANGLVQDASGFVRALACLT